MIYSNHLHTIYTPSTQYNTKSLLCCVSVVFLLSRCIKDGLNKYWDKQMVFACINKV